MQTRSTRRRIARLALGLLFAAGLLDACAYGPGNHLAYVADHPIASPRVPFYRYDAKRMVEVEFVQDGTERSRYWFVDPARGIASLLSDRPTPACQFAAPAWDTSFNTFEVRLPTLVELPPHYASDDPDLVMFARAVPTGIWQKTGPGEHDLDTAWQLDTLVSQDGGRHFSLHSVLLNPAPAKAAPQGDGPQYADYSDIPVRVDRFSELRFLIVRGQTAYLGLAKVTPTREQRWSDVTVNFLGRPTAVFAFDPRSTEALPRARLLRGTELTQFALPLFDQTTHQTDAGLLARARPSGSVVYDEEDRRKYIEALRPQFPQWAAQQRVEIGRQRFLTTEERLAYVEAARKRGDPCAGWAVD